MSSLHSYAVIFIHFINDGNFIILFIFLSIKKVNNSVLQPYGIKSFQYIKNLEPDAVVFFVNNIVDNFVDDE